MVRFADQTIPQTIPRRPLFPPPKAGDRDAFWTGVWAPSIGRRLEEVAEVAKCLAANKLLAPADLGTTPGKVSEGCLRISAHLGLGGMREGARGGPVALGVSMQHLVHYWGKVWRHNVRGTPAASRPRLVLPSCCGCAPASPLARDAFQKHPPPTRKSHRRGKNDTRTQNPKRTAASAVGSNQLTSPLNTQRQGAIPRVVMRRDGDWMARPR